MVKPIPLMMSTTKNRNH